MQPDELRAWLRLSLTPGVGNAGARRLLAAFASPQAIFQQSATALQQVVSATQSASLLVAPPELDALVAATAEWLQTEPEQRCLLTLGDADYPQSLLNMEDPPLLLYAAGNWRALNRGARNAIAVVGSRNPTPQGGTNAHQFSKALAQAGLTIVSGMALGIDGAAHAGALEGAGPDQLATIAVVGTGLDRVYPKQHRELAHQIAQRGVLLSEYALGTPPLAANFPQRNRIIAGLSCGTLVVEAALQSGSLITARLAVEQGKDVFAIPGSIHSTQARGCHALIRQGAKLVESAQDILEELQIPEEDQSTPVSGADHAQYKLDSSVFGADSQVLVALGFDPTSLDALQARTGIATPALQAELMTLELQGQVARLAGGLFLRTVKS